MAWDLATAYDRTGATSSPENDLELQMAMDVALTSVETYLDRKLLLAEETETFIYPGPVATLSLVRYPISDVASVVLDGTAATDFKVRKQTGQLMFGCRRTPSEIVVEYEGGYQTLPAALEWALWTLFDAVWSEAQAVSAGAGSTIVEGSGELKQITIFGVGSMSYDVGSTVVSGGEGGATAALLNPSDRFSSLLEMYRRVSA